MKAARNSHAAITYISAVHHDAITTRKGSTGSSKDKSQTLIEKMSTQFPSPTKKTESNEVGKSGDSKPKVSRRRGRRKSS